MSREVMRYLTVFSYKKDTRELLRRLTQLRCVEMLQAELEEADTALSFDRNGTAEELRRAEEKVATIEEAIETLTPYTKRKNGRFQKRGEVDITEFMSGERHVRAMAALKETKRVADELEKLCLLEKEKRALYDFLSPFAAYPRPLGLRGTEFTEIILGSLPESVDYSVFLRSIEGFYATAERVFFKEKSPTVVCIICHVSDTQALLNMLDDFSFERVEFPEDFVRAGKEIEKVRTSLADIAERKAKAMAALSALAKRIDEIKILYDVEKTALDIIEREMKLGQTEQTDLLCAWVPESEEKRVVMTLESFDAAYELRDAREDDQAPVLFTGVSKLFSKLFKQFYVGDERPFEAAAPSEKYIIEK